MSCGVNYSHLQVSTPPSSGAGEAGRAGAPTDAGSSLSHSPSRTRAWLRPVQAGDLEALREAARSDNHTVIEPTHVIEVLADGHQEIVGYVSLAAVALVNLWAHSKKVKARDSLSLLNVVENVAALSGQRVLCLPCSTESPFRPVMGKLGYQFGGETALFYKALKG